MQIGMIGLGRMGANMVHRLLAGGHECVVYALSETTRQEMASHGAEAADSIENLVERLVTPRTIWIMVPDQVVDEVIGQLSGLLGADDTIIDGGNSYFPDDVRRAQNLKKQNIRYLDVGTSGGTWGRDRGYCLMIGGEKDAVDHLEPIFRTLAPGQDAAPPTPGRQKGKSTADRGYLHCGGHGAGHFVKMVHNGIEYGVMAAYAEGFAMLKTAQEEGAGAPATHGMQIDVDTGEVAELWRRGSVVGSWLLDLAAMSLSRDPALAEFDGDVADSGEGRWTVKTAVDLGVPAHVLSMALFNRYSSRGKATYANKVLSALRFAFGGHVEKS
jgi:6-phosphogluconate dehydrogenase